MKGQQVRIRVQRDIMQGDPGIVQRIAVDPAQKVLRRLPDTNTKIQNTTCHQLCKGGREEVPVKDGTEGGGQPAEEGST